MDLFIINRYTGEDVDSSENTQREKQLLTNLLSKISERKNRIKTENKEGEKDKREEQFEEQFIQNENPVISKKGSKKKKLDSLIKEEYEKVELEAYVTDSSPKKKVKLKDIKSIEGFTIIGTDEFTKRKKVKRVLPGWLANPFVVSVNLHNLTVKISGIPELDLSLVQKLQENGLTHFFPVQSQLIPWLIREHEKPSLYRPSDICVSAPTGSGKTLAFVLPIIQALKDRIVPRLRALVVLPVQELAAQVFSVFKDYTQNTDLKVVLITGKNSFSVEKNLLVYKHPLLGYQSLIDIIVTTPGRLVDHLHNTEGFSVQHLRFLVIDEADRVMEHQQNDWLYHLTKRFQQMESLTINALEESVFSPPPQKLLFSATLSQDPEKLQNLNLFQPKLFTSIVENLHTESLRKIDTGTFIGKYTTPAELCEKYLITSLSNKPLLSFLLIIGEEILQSPPRRTLCFANSQSSAHRLSLVLGHMGKERNIRVAEMSAALPKRDRARMLEEFTKGTINVLVSTDSLARGIDLPQIDLVISYDPAAHLKTYIHRVGRTARAGQQGTAISCLLDTQLKAFKSMVEVADKTHIQHLQIPQSQIDQYQDQYQQALETLAIDIENERSEKIDKEKQLRKQTQKPFKKRKRKLSLKTN